MSIFRQLVTQRLSLLADPSVVFVLTEERPCSVLKAVDCGEADGHLLPGNGADITVIAFTGGIIVVGREQL